MGVISVAIGLLSFLGLLKMISEFVTPETFWMIVVSVSVLGAVVG